MRSARSQFAFKVRPVTSRTGQKRRRSHCSDDPAPVGQRCDICDRRVTAQGGTGRDMLFRDLEPPRLR